MSSISECPWCNESVYLENQVCPNCKHEVLSEHLNDSIDTIQEGNEQEAIDQHLNELDIEDQIASKFKCSKCGALDCSVKEVAMTGTGISKILDIQHIHYLFISCLSCGSVEVYDPDVLRGHKSGQLGTILDIIFGR